MNIHPKNHGAVPLQPVSATVAAASTTDVASRLFTHLAGIHSVRGRGDERRVSPRLDSPLRRLLKVLLRVHGHAAAKISEEFLVGRPRMDAASAARVIMRTTGT